MAPCFPWFLSFGNRTQNSRVAGARPNHQPIGGSDPNHHGTLEPKQGGAGSSRLGIQSSQNSRVAGARSNHQPIEGHIRVCRVVVAAVLGRSLAAAGENARRTARAPAGVSEDELLQDIRRAAISTSVPAGLRAADPRDAPLQVRA